MTNRKELLKQAFAAKLEKCKNHTHLTATELKAVREVQIFSTAHDNQMTDIITQRKPPENKVYCSG
jgi:hypothetical protein